MRDKFEQDSIIELAIEKERNLQKESGREILLVLFPEEGIIENRKIMLVSFMSN